MSVFSSERCWNYEHDDAGWGLSPHSTLMNGDDDLDSKQKLHAMVVAGRCTYKIGERAQQQRKCLAQFAPWFDRVGRMSVVASLSPTHLSEDLVRHASCGSLPEDLVGACVV